MKRWQVHVISLEMCPTTVKQLLRCTATVYLLCSLSSSQNVFKWLTNTRTPCVLVHVMAAHTEFHYELVTRSSGCTLPLCHVHFRFSPPVVLLNQWNVLIGIDCTFYCLILTGIDGLMRFKTNQLRSYQVPERENYTSEQWLHCSLCFREAKGPPLVYIELPLVCTVQILE